METTGFDVHADTAIQHRTTFDFVRYANCWEDADILVDALHPRPGTRVLSIASAGDNALALLAEGAEVIAADLSVAQLACLELRCAAFRQLDYDGVLAFLGVQEARRPADDTMRHSQAISRRASRAFWAAHPQAGCRGDHPCGKIRGLFSHVSDARAATDSFAKRVGQLLEPKDEAARREFWNKSWNNWRWRLLFRVFFSRFLMGRLGRDPEFFRYVEGSVSDRIMQRAHYALTVLPTHGNPYLDYIATGNFSSALPRYLRPEHFEAIRSGLDRLTLFHGPIERAARVHAATGFDAFNLSDIFEYIDTKATSEFYGELLNVARPGARLAYWNTFVPRSCPAEYAGRVEPLTELSAELFARDMAFFYCHFQVDEVADGELGANENLSAILPFRRHPTSVLGQDFDHARAAVHLDPLTGSKSLGEAGDADDGGDAHFPGDDGGVRQDAAAFDENPRERRIQRDPAGIGSLGDQDVALKVDAGRTDRGRSSRGRVTFRDSSRSRQRTVRKCCRCGLTPANRLR